MTKQTSQMIQHMRRALHPEEAALTDGQLLGCFIERRDETAFATLVKRHGPLVWSACRRLLSPHDAEDAFQATFLVLCRKAASIRQREMVASWLFGVAHQTALQARRTAGRRHAREKQVMAMPEPAAIEQEPSADLHRLLDQELRRLPDRYQVVILLCDLEGKTRTEAARQLGLPEGTIGSRLARARGMLAKRLARHGVALSAGALTALLAPPAASAGVPSAVVTATMKTASLVATGQGMSGSIPAKVIALSERVLKIMLLKKLKTLGTALLVLALVGLGGALYLHQAQAQQPPDDPPPIVGQPQGTARAPAPGDKVKPQDPKDALAGYPILTGKLAQLLGHEQGYVKPKPGEPFRLNLADLASVKQLSFDPKRKSYIPLPGPLVVEFVNYYGNGAFRNMRLVSRSQGAGRSHVTIDISPGPGIGPNAVQVWVVVEYEVVTGVALIEAEASGKFPNRPAAPVIVPQLNPDQKVTVGRIITVGATTTDDAIRKAVQIFPGDKVTAKALEQAEKKLVELGLFEIDLKNGVRPSVTAIKTNDPVVRDILIRVKEANPK